MTMDEKRLAEIEALHDDVNVVLELVAEVRRLRQPTFNPDWFAKALDLIAHDLQGVPASISHDDRVKYLLTPAGKLHELADEMRARAKEWNDA